MVDSNCTSGNCWERACSNPNDADTLKAKIAELRGLAKPSSDGEGNEWFQLEDIFQVYDRDGDGFITREEWPETDAVFDAIDINRDDKISPDEINDNRYYRVVGYNFTPSSDPNILGWGVLTLEGRSRKSAATDLTKTLPDIDKDDNAASRNRVVVSIPILPSRPLAFDRTTAPALWISEGAPEDGAKFEGDVVIGDPNTEKDIECSISRDKIQQPTPAPNTPYKAQFFRDTFPPRETLKETDFPEGQRNLELTSPETFPRLGDTESPSGAYEYFVNNINLSGSDQITITPGERVVFYVKGNINGAIKHDCSSVSPPTVCKPGNLQIYAYGEAGNLIGGTPDPEICLRGSERLEAFIFAPNYSLGKTGTGAFVGAAWGKNWGKNSGCASPNNTVAVTQGVEWTELIRNLQPNPSKNLPRLDGIANWCEEPIDTAPGASECN